MRGTSLLVAATLLYLLTLGGTLFSLEVAYYQRQKWDIIQDGTRNQRYFENDSANRMSASGRAYIMAINGQLPEAQIADLRQRAEADMRAAMAATPWITRLRLEDATGTTILKVEDTARIWPQNNFANSLLTRNFENFVSQSFLTLEEATGKQRTAGVVRLFVTTATPNDAIPNSRQTYQQITTLTDTYRLLMLIATSVISFAYVGLLRFVLLPLGRVLNFMQRRDGTRASIIPTPRTQLERVYNDLARDAVLTRFSKELREFIIHKTLSHAEPVLEAVPDFVAAIIGVPWCHVQTFARRGAAGRWTPEKSWLVSPEWLDAEHFRTALAKTLDNDAPDAKPHFWRGRVLLYLQADGAGRAYYCDVLSASPEHATLFIVHSPPNAPPPSAWWVDFHGRIAQELRYTLSNIDDQRRLLLQEKSKANVSLSRNLGHDLTNIIATSRLDLMTLKSLLALDPNDLKRSPTKSEIFAESLQGLLNNSRFLQEIVNLYRSFSYLQKPKFEDVDVDHLMKHIVELFALSVSREFVLTTRCIGTIPPWRGEPRLLRLALFNLLTNATEAIRRNAGVGHSAGSIELTAVHFSERELVEIRIADSGPGIRDEAGNLIPDESLNEVFRLGYSTKSSQEGEGLGLNWVQSIVREFHGGEVLATNRPEGGACFIIRLPKLSPEDHPVPNTPEHKP